MSTNSLKEIFLDFHHQINRARLLQNTRDLWQKEFGQTFDSYHASAKLAENLLKQAGGQSVERIAFPADGKTVFQDKTMPLGWRASSGKLEVVQSKGNFADPILADYERHPFHLIKGSVATPPEGIVTRLISEEDLYAGADPRGAMVLLNPEDRPSYRNLRNTGILGIVSDYLVGRHDTPSALLWANACTESSSWHTRADEAPHIGFVVSPTVGDQLRVAMRGGEVQVRVTSNGERYEDIIETVTGVVPGEDEREIWLLAHLYEPLANDNSSGVACAIEIVHALQALISNGTFPQPHFTLRLVFAMEAYGFAAYAEHRGGYLRDKVLCAVNIDALPILSSDREVSAGLSQSGSPSSADYLLETLLTGGLVESLEVSSIQTEGVYADDRLLADSTIGLPTLWFTRDPRTQRGETQSPKKGLYLWHNSHQDMSCIEEEAFHDVTALYGTWAAAILTASEEDLAQRLSAAEEISHLRLENEATIILKKLEQNEFAHMANDLGSWLGYRLEIESARLKDFSRFGGSPEAVRQALANLEATFQHLDKEVKAALAASPPSPEPLDQAWQIAETIIITRTTRGLPRDFAQVPPEHRARLLEMPVTIALVQADGRRTAAELFRRAQWELRTHLTPKQLMSSVGSLQFLTQYGYIDLVSSQSVTKSAIVQALKKAGIKEGDLLLAHTALSPLGVVEGGADTVIDALLEAIGETGTLLMPTFTRSFLCFEKGPARSKALVPFHPQRGPVTTGMIPETFRQRPGVIRTPHPSHSIAGLGPRAQECLSSHGATEAPTGASSPWAKLHQLNGKIVFLGARLDACTFLHYLESEAKVDYLVSSICVVDDDEKGRRIVAIPENVPGLRDFYCPQPENSKIFRRLKERGLAIETVPIGFSELKVIEAAPFYRHGMNALAETPDILLNSKAP